MGKLIYKIFTKVLLGLIGVFLIFVGIYVGKRVITKDVTSSVLGFSFYRVSTGSMIPDINPGDLVVVKSRKEYVVGMDVTYRIDKNATPVTHRIISIDEDMVTTEGINNTGSDTPFEKKYIIGEVVFVWKNYDKFVNFITSPLGIVILCAGVFGIVELFSFIDKIVNKSKEDDNVELVKEK